MVVMLPPPPRPPPTLRQRHTASICAECQVQQARGIYLQVAGSADHQLSLLSDSVVNFNTPPQYFLTVSLEAILTNVMKYIEF